jgi:hypothetical protein
MLGYVLHAATHPLGLHLYSYLLKILLVYGSVYVANLLVTNKGFDREISIVIPPKYVIYWYKISDSM